MGERRRRQLAFLVARKRGPRWLYRALPAWATVLLLLGCAAIVIACSRL